MNLYKKTRYFFAFLVFSVLNFSLADLARSQGFGPVDGGQAEAFRNSSGFAAADGSSLARIVSVVIQAFLGLLGVIFLVLLITAGYKWMTAAGNEEKMTEAKGTIWRAVIGLIITVAAYAITYFVFNSLDWVGGGPEATGGSGWD
ncbi:MAG: pilin [Patescibacteria group bacterium]|nr:pilin [Patescibacteria group bacterium]